MHVPQKLRALQDKSIPVQYLRSPTSHVYQVLIPSSQKIVRCRPADFYPIPPAPLPPTPPCLLRNLLLRNLVLRKAFPQIVLIILLRSSFLPHITTAKAVSLIPSTTKLSFPPQTNPGSLKSALRLPDAQDRARAHDHVIDRKIKLGAWKPIPIADIDKAKTVEHFGATSTRRMETALWRETLHAAQFAATS